VPNNSGCHLPVHHACGTGAPKNIVRLLINSGRNGTMGIADGCGWLPIQYVCRRDMNLGTSARDIERAEECRKFLDMLNRVGLSGDRVCQ